MPSSTVEDYLKTILKLESDLDEASGDLVGTGRIAAELGVAPGTVTSMVKTLAEAGLVAHEPYSGVRLTSSGRRLAGHVLRRHRLIELFLVQVMGMDWSSVHPEAERLEHAVSDELVERMDEMLGRPSVDPHGDPIPDREGAITEAELPSLASCPVGERLRVSRVIDQEESFLQLVEGRGLMPGSEIEVRERDRAADTVELDVDGDTARLGLRAASKILVEGIRP